jgi:uncharacterized protein YyaL (SSP411 family)
VGENGSMQEDPMFENPIKLKNYCLSALCCFCAMVLMVTPVTGQVNTQQKWKDINWVMHFDRGMERAEKTGRPVFIYFQAPWCSWCHVYERETLANARVQQLISTHFVPILVNYDARPDLLQEYRGFGLPYTVILDWQGDVLSRMPGILTPGDMIDSLQAARRGVKQDGPGNADIVARASGLDEQSYRVFLDAWLEHLDMLYDSNTGLFSGVLESGAGLKRPAAQTWLFLQQQDLWPERVRRAASVNYDQLYDQLNGGFFYFRDPHRADIHLETAKLLDANSWLIYWLHDTGLANDDHRLIAAARRSLDYLMEVLWDDNDSGFFQAQQADNEYYVTTSTMVPPQVDRIKRADTNAQAAYVFARLSARSGNSELLDLAVLTISALLENHLHGEYYYHAIDERGPGEISNHPHDIFWTLLAVYEIDTLRPGHVNRQLAATITRLAIAWVEAQQHGNTELTVELAGLVALVIAKSEKGLFRENAINWTLGQLRIDSMTRPDDLVPGLLAWKLHLEN